MKRPQLPIPEPSYRGCVHLIVSFFKTLRNSRKRESQDRQIVLAVFWWTRNMSGEDLKTFLLSDGGGLLTGASFEKFRDWDKEVQERVWFRDMDITWTPRRMTPYEGTHK